LAAQIKIELDSYSKAFHLKIGFLFLFTIFTLYFLFQKINPPTNYFKATFNYVEGIEIGSDIKLAGIAIGKVTNFEIDNDLVEVLGFINQDIDIPKDSTASIRSDGLFGKKSILINPGFDIPFDSSDKNITFMETSDSYSIDMFLRYLKNLNE
jgi:phospholipid/cholesterol/gamma-HCH transport system substrate-binding protein